MIEPRIEKFFPDDGKTTFRRADVSHAIDEFLGDDEVCSAHEIRAGRILRQGIESGAISHAGPRVYRRGLPPPASGVWERCDTRMPEKAGSYLVWNRNRIILTIFNGHKWECAHARTVSHWMPLPDAPQSEELT